MSKEELKILYEALDYKLNNIGGKHNETILLEKLEKIIEDNLSSK